jgi:hypothetical protein
MSFPKLKPEAEVDQIVDLKPIRCRACGHLFLGEDPEPARHQVSEVPAMKATITEYRRPPLSCLACGAGNEAPWLVEVPRGCLGPRAQAAIGYFTGRLGLSHRDVVDVMDVLPGVKVSGQRLPREYPHLSRIEIAGEPEWSRTPTRGVPHTLARVRLSTPFHNLVLGFRM